MKNPPLFFKLPQFELEDRYLPSLLSALAAAAHDAAPQVFNDPDWLLLALASGIDRCECRACSRGRRREMRAGEARNQPAAPLRTCCTHSMMNPPALQHLRPWRGTRRLVSQPRTLLHAGQGGVTPSATLALKVAAVLLEMPICMISTAECRMILQPPWVRAGRAEQVTVLMIAEGWTVTATGVLQTAFPRP